MKTLLLPFILGCLLTSFGAFGQNGWTRQNPKPGSANYQFIHMSSAGNGYASGDYGEIVQTINHGNFWYRNEVLNSGNEQISSLCFLNDSIAFLSQSNGKLKKSIDGGITWTLIAQGLPTLNGLVFKNPLLGFAWVGVGVSKLIYRTTNGGLTWQNRNTVQAYIALDQVISTSRLIGPWANQLTVSNDGGTTWALQDIGCPKWIRSMTFVNDTIGYLVGDSGTVGKTIDGGQTWNFNHIISDSNSLSYSSFQKVHFVNPLVGFVLEPYGKMLRTLDGGNTWTRVILMAEAKPKGIHFTDPQNGWISGLQGLLARTSDGGNTWQLQSKSFVNIVRSAAFQGVKRTWVVGDNGLVRHSDDGGLSWQKVLLDSGGFFTQIYFPTPQVGYIAGNGSIYRTKNSGNSWEKFPVGFNASKIQFVHPDTGWAIGWSGYARTTDGGNSWTSSTGPSDDRDIHFFDSKTGVKLAGAGAYTILVLSQNGGLDFDSILLLRDYVYPYTMFFLNRQIGWIGTDSYKILKTSDGGQTWQTLISPHQNTYQMHFSDSLNGYALGDAGYYETHDGGTLWEQFVAPGGNILTTSYRGMLLSKNKPVFIWAGSGLFTLDSWNGSSRFLVGGKVVRKLNSDCMVDENELPLEKSLVVANPGSYFGITNSTGNYGIALDSGNYQISQLISHYQGINLQSQYCPPANAVIPVSITGQLDTITGNNFINEVKDCPILVIQQTQSALHPCRWSTLFIAIENKGNLVSDTEYVHIKFPPQLHLISASAIFDYNATDSTYRFRINPLQPFESFNFSIVNSVDCNPSQLLGKILCVKATIPNMPNCLLQSPNWDGANLEVASRCQNGQTNFTIHNKGNAMPNSAQYRIFIDSALVYQANFQLAANNSMTVTLPANAPAGFVRLVVPQSAFHPLSTFASAEANCATGLSTNGMFPPPDESPLVDIECVTVTNAVDPNDKQVYPTGWGTEGNVEPETEFKYTVRFQNTGTDTAFKVVLVDTLDAGLDIASLQIGSASHPFEFKVSGKGRPILSWTFNNILLPDSNTNQEKSNGFVSFSIRPKTGLALGARLENFADIYFDFNDPVRTNTTVNTLWMPTYTPGVLDTVFTASQKLMVSKRLNVYPNPSKGSVELNSPQPGMLQVFSLRGELLVSKPVSEGRNQINLSTLPKGLYLLKLQTENGVQAQKLVLE